MINDRSAEANKLSNKRGGGKGGRPRIPYETRYCKGCGQLIEPDRSEPSYRHNRRALHKGRQQCYAMLRKQEEKPAPMKSNPHWGYA